MVQRRATVRNAHGIHCRPSAVIIKAMEGYAGKVSIQAASGTTDLRSMLGLLTLGLECGKEVTISVDGPDEAATADKLVELFEHHFDFPPRQ